MPEPERITRRDFLNGTLLASGAALVSAACPFQLMAAEDWNGSAGVGDYAGANGNTHQVMADGHTIRDHAFERAPKTVEDTGESFDCVVVGGGISGLAAALFYQRAMSAKGMGAKKSCLVLENHPIFGGEAKRNEFNVDGQRLIASQGSAMWFQPMPGSFLQHFYDSVGIDPREFQYQRNASAIATGVTPYAGDGSNFGFFFRTDSQHPDGMWLVDPWTKRLEGAPISAEAKRELLAMRDVPDRRPTPRRHGDAVARQLDSITLEDDLIMRHGLSRETIRRYLSPVSGGGSGIGADVLSAYSDYAPDLLFPWEKQHGPQMFPGGNTGVARHIVKVLLPAAIPGQATMSGICQSRVEFAALDRPNQPTRIRLRATVVSIEHEGEAARAPHVNIVYFREGRLHRVRARSVVLANGNWTINSIVRDLPAEYRHAYAQFFRAPCIMANVAVRNWRFLAKMGISQCQWFDGIGNYLAVRRVATFGGGATALSPDSPTVLTLKILFANPGKSLPEQVNTGRYQMMTTPFSAYEKQIREQFARMFGKQGFDGRRDIAGIILNRWGHAYLTPQPGFFFGKDGKRPPAELMRQHPFGRVAFANSDLSGIMDHRASIVEAHRAVRQVLASGM